jgi:hypothetical protein
MARLPLIAPWQATSKSARASGPAAILELLTVLSNGVDGHDSMMGIHVVVRILHLYEIGC